MKFDAVIGNPPYQKKCSDYSAKTMSIYHKFVILAKNLDAEKITMIIPARWYASGNMKEFRDEMTLDKKLAVLVDIYDSNNCFEGVKIGGGICYFLCSNAETENCEFWSFRDGVLTFEEKRDLGQFNIIVRNSAAIPIIEKVLKKSDRFLNEQVFPKEPFGIKTIFKDFHDSPALMKDPIVIFRRGGQSWVERARVKRRHEIIEKHKVLVGTLYCVGEVSHPITAKPIYAAAGSCCTETYLVCCAFEDQMHAANFLKYMRTRFFRFMLSMRKNTQNTARDRFGFCPIMNMEIAWTDAMLYDFFKLSDSEVSLIETRIRGWD